MKQNIDRLRELSTISPPDRDNLATLERIAYALEVIAGTVPAAPPDWESPAYYWDPAQKTLQAATEFQPLSLELLIGVEQQTELLERNTRQFARGLPANNALLWGARGTGKSSLAKAVFHKLRGEQHSNLHLVEIHKEDLCDLPLLLKMLAACPEQMFILFLDDLSFEASDDRYKNLKSSLEGGVSGQPKNLLIYATSNRRHLMPRTFSENENSHLHPSETAEENISLSDRFGLWLGFYAYDQDTYLRMVASYARTFNIPVAGADLNKLALEWSMTRGARSGRVAWQFIKDLAGQHNKPVA